VAQCQVPNLLNLTYNQALTAWSGRGFTGSLTRQPSGGWNNNSTPIRQQEIAANQMRPCDTSMWVDRRNP
jgi:hypothetical protein